MYEFVPALNFIFAPPPRVANFQKMKFGTRRQRRRDRDAVGVEGEGVGNGEGNPVPSRLGGLGSVVSSASGVRGGAPAENEFGAY